MSNQIVERWRGNQCVVVCPLVVAVWMPEVRIAVPVRLEELGKAGHFVDVENLAEIHEAAACKCIKAHGCVGYVRHGLGFTMNARWTEWSHIWRAFPKIPDTRAFRSTSLPIPPHTFSVLHAVGNLPRSPLRPSAPPDRDTQPPAHAGRRRGSREHGTPHPRRRPCSASSEPARSK